MIYIFFLDNKDYFLTAAYEYYELIQAWGGNLINMYSILGVL